MQASNRGVDHFIKRLLGRLAIGQILREDYLYEVHGPFLAVASAPSPRRFVERLTGRLSALIQCFTPARPPS